MAPIAIAMDKNRKKNYSLQYTTPDIHQGFSEFRMDGNSGKKIQYENVVRISWNIVGRFFKIKYKFTFRPVPVAFWLVSEIAIHSKITSLPFFLLLLG